MLQVDEFTIVEEKKNSKKGSSPKGSDSGTKKSGMNYGQLINLLSNSEQCQT